MTANDSMTPYDSMTYNDSMPLNYSMTPYDSMTYKWFDDIQWFNDIQQFNDSQQFDDSQRFSDIQWFKVLPRPWQSIGKFQLHYAVNPLKQFVSVYLFIQIVSNLLMCYLAVNIKIGTSPVILAVIRNHSNYCCIAESQCSSNEWYVIIC